MANSMTKPRLNTLRRSKKDKSKHYIWHQSSFYYNRCTFSSCA